MQRKTSIKILAAGGILFVLPFLIKFPSSEFILIAGIIMIPLGLFGTMYGSTTPKYAQEQNTTKERKTNWPIIIGAIVAIGFLGNFIKPNQLAATTTAATKITADSNLEARCAKGDPHKAFIQLQEISVWNTDKEPVLVHIRPDYWNLLKNNPDQKRQVVEAIANTDACVEGKLREIRVFSSDSVLIGSASPSNGIRIIP